MTYRRQDRPAEQPGTGLTALQVEPRRGLDDGEERVGDQVGDFGWVGDAAGKEPDQLRDVRR